MQLGIAATSLLGSLAVLATGGVGVAAGQSTGLSHSVSPGSAGSAAITLERLASGAFGVSLTVTNYPTVLLKQQAA